MTKILVDIHHKYNDFIIVAGKNGTYYKIYSFKYIKIEFDLGLRLLNKLVEINFVFIALQLLLIMENVFLWTLFISFEKQYIYKTFLYNV